MTFWHIDVFNVTKLNLKPNVVSPKQYHNTHLYDNSYIFEYFKINYLCKNFSHLKRL